MLYNTLQVYRLVSRPRKNLLLTYMKLRLPRLLLLALLCIGSQGAYAALRVNTAIGSYDHRGGAWWGTGGAIPNSISHAGEFYYNGYLIDGNRSQHMGIGTYTVSYGGAVYVYEVAGSNDSRDGAVGYFSNGYFVPFNDDNIFSIKSFGHATATCHNADFSYNKASGSGGAIFVDGDITFTGDSRFVGNSAGRGAAVYSGPVPVGEQWAVNFVDGHVHVAQNVSTGSGGYAINAGTVSIVNEAQDKRIELIGNENGVLKATDTLTITKAHTLRARENTKMGAVLDGADVQINDVLYMDFEENEYAGIRGNNISIQGSHEVNFRNNEAAIITYSSLSIRDCQQVLISGTEIETTNRYGWYGAITSIEGSAEFSDIGSLVFDGNRASSGCAALWVHAGATFQDIDKVAFTNNHTGNGRGAAIRKNFGDGELLFNRIKDISFIGNTATENGVYDAGQGGAISSYGNIIFSDNDSILFSANQTIYEFSSSGRGAGAAIHAEKDLSISNNGRVVFEGNKGFDKDGAIHVKGNLSIEGNDYVEFRGNYAKETNSLNGIYMSSTAGQAKLAAKTGGEIVFYDAVYLSAGGISLNGEYSDAEGNTQIAEGRIVFSGKYAETDLARVGDAQADLTKSLTTQFYAAATLHNGTLEVTDGAILHAQSYGLTLEAGAGVEINRGGELKVKGLTVGENRSLSMNRGTLTSNAGVTINGGEANFCQGSTLVLDRNALNITDGATLGFALNAWDKSAEAVTVQSGSTTFGEVTVQLHNADELGVGEYAVMNMSGSTISGWTADNITLGAGLAFADFSLRDGILYYTANNTWNIIVTASDTIDELPQSGNAFVYGGGELTISSKFSAAAAGEEAHGKAHGRLVLENGQATVTENGELEGYVHFRGAEENDRVLTIARDALVLNQVKVEGEAGRNEIEVQDTHTVKITQLEGNGELTKTGSGDIALTAENEFAGAVNIEEGRILLTGQGTLNADSVTIGAPATTFSRMRAMTPSTSITTESGISITQKTAGVQAPIKNAQEMAATATTMGGEAESPATYTNARIAVDNAGTEFTLQHAQLVNTDVYVSSSTHLALQHLNLDGTSAVCVEDALSSNVVMDGKNLLVVGELAAELSHAGRSLTLSTAQLNGVLLSKTGSLTLDLSSDLLAGYPDMVRDNYMLTILLEGFAFEEGGSITLDASELNDSVDFGAQVLSVENTRDGVLVTTRLIPEPSSTALSLLALAAMAVRRRRK